MAAVGDGGCVCTGHGLWSLFVVHLLFCGHCGHLCSWASLFVVIMGGCHHLQCGWSSSVVCLEGGGKEKRNHVMLPNKHCLLSMTNK